MKKSILFLSLMAIIFLLGPSIGYCNSISNIKIDPSWPTRLSFGQKINISFDYNISHKGGVRIFVRPFTGGTLTPDYAASASGIHTGHGRGSGFFTIQSGNQIKVDQVRFQVYNADQTELIFEFFIPVDYTFSNLAINLKTPLLLEVVPMKPANTAEPPTSPKKQKILPDGTVEIKYPDGRIVQRFAGGVRIIYPDGRPPDVYLHSTAARAAIPPSTPDNAELRWMEEHSKALLAIIESLVDHDAASVTNYLQFEGAVNIYEQIIKREETINYLVQP